MSSLTSEARAALLGALSTPNAVEVTELLPKLAKALGGAKLYIHELTSPQKVQWRKENQEDHPVDQDIRLVISCLVDEHGACVLTKDDIPTLQKATATITQLSVLALRINGMLWDAEGALKNAHWTLLSNGQQQGEVERSGS